LQRFLAILVFAMENVQVKKGTTTVGIVCKEGIVLAAEKRATIGSFVADKNAEKIVPISSTMLVTTAGTVSDAQLIVKLMRAELKLKQVRTNREATVKEAANLMGSIVYNNIRRYSLIPGITQFLLAGTDEEGVHLYDLFVDGSVMVCPDYVTSGSGSIIVYGVLETQYKKGMSLKDGLDLAQRAITAAIQRDSASGNGLLIYTITPSGITKVLEKTFETALKA
jgi:proteasome beta subunit